MKNYRFLVPLVLVLMLVASVYVLYDGKASVRDEYNTYVETARDYREQGIFIDAEENYLLAIDVQPNLDMYLELGSLYMDHNLPRMAKKLSRNLLKEYPQDAGSYEYALQLYMSTNDYIECYDLIDTMRKRGLTSEYMEQLALEIEYEYYFVADYDHVSVFGGGMCPVEREGKWGFVDTYGTRYVSLQFAEVGPFSGGLAPVVDAEGNAYYIDNQGNKKKVILNVDNIQKLGLIENNVFALYNGKTWGFYDGDGNHLFGDYQETSNIGNGVAAVKTGSGWQLVDYDGKDLTGNTYKSVWMDEKLIVHRNDRIFVEVDGGYQMIDTAGKVHSKHTYEAVQLFNDTTYAAVKMDGKWGFVDKNGEIILEPQYEDARSFSNGYAAVKVDGLWGYIKADGQMVIPCTFVDAKDFTASGTAFVMVEDEWELLKLYKYNH